MSGPRCRGSILALASLGAALQPSPRTTSASAQEPASPERTFTVIVEHAGQTIELQNTLGQAASAYLRSAAHQPIAWQQWGPEAFELARRLNRPILLDIGAVWCHWCHVMDHESYEDPEVARLINEHFIAVKVDRDERPDVDIRYQRLVQAITQAGGGWPLTAFLTPSGDVFSGGTYFPREDRWGRRGMLSVLPLVAEVYHERNLGKESEIAEVNRQVLAASEERLAAGVLSPRWLSTVRTAMAYEYEPTHGGFGMASGPKFPATGAVEFLLRLASERDDAEARAMALGTLEAMADGGIHDQIAGGFHRYSVDGLWRVPHFEKMLYDNAALLANFAHAFAATGDPRHRDVAVGIIDFALDTLERPEGGFGGSQDADIGPDDDGDHYTWTVDEARACLTDEEFQLASRRWDIAPRGEMHHNAAKNVLWNATPIEDLAHAFNRSVDEVRALLASAREKMRAVRRQRPAPFVDPTIYVSWNGLMIHALCEADRFVGDPRARGAALRAARGLESACWRPGEGWAHALAVDGTVSGGFLDDQAQMALACLALSQVTGDRHWLELALATLEVMSRRFWDTEAQAFRDTPIDTAGGVAALGVPSFPFIDQPTPAANPSAALAFELASVITGDAALHGRAEQTMRSFVGGDPRRGGHMIGTAAQAVAALVWGTPSVVVIGDPADPRTEALRRAALTTWRPGLVVAGHAPGEKDLPYPPAADGRPLAHVCAGRACAPPVDDPARLPEVIRSFGRQ